jgi:uncharacterized protein YqgC (DUF456 family)
MRTKEVSIQQRLFGIFLIILGIIGCFVPIMPGIILILLGIAVWRGKSIDEAIDEIKGIFGEIKKRLRL